MYPPPRRIECENTSTETSDGRLVTSVSVETEVEGVGGTEFEFGCLSGCGRAFGRIGEESGDGECGKCWVEVMHSVQKAPVTAVDANCESSCSLLM